ncbi:MAG: hypothetical protein ABIR81_09245 [Ginsengibacter sp.]
MKTSPKHIMVDMPNQSRLDVSYYCSDTRLPEDEKEKFTELILQLHNCHCRKKVTKAAVSKKNDVEHLVEKMVINAKGHLC